MKNRRIIAIFLAMSFGLSMLSQQVIALEVSQIDFVSENSADERTGLDSSIIDSSQSDSVQESLETQPQMTTPEVPAVAEDTTQSDLVQESSGSETQPQVTTEASVITAETTQGTIQESGVQEETSLAISGFENSIQESELRNAYDELMKYCLDRGNDINFKYEDFLYEYNLRENKNVAEYVQLIKDTIRPNSGRQGRSTSGADDLQWYYDTGTTLPRAVDYSTNNLLQTVKRGDLIFDKNGGGRVFGHAGIIEGIYYDADKKQNYIRIIESVSTGVSYGVLSEDRYHDRNTSIYRIRGVTSEQIDWAIAFYKSQLGKDWGLDLSHNYMEEKDTWMCSTLIWAGFMRQGIDLENKAIVDNGVGVLPEDITVHSPMTNKVDVEFYPEPKAEEDRLPDTMEAANQCEAVSASQAVLIDGLQHTGDEDWVKVNLPYSGAIQYSVESCNPITVWFKAYKKGTATLAYHTVFSGTGVYRSLTRLEPELYDYYINIYSNYVTDYEVSLAYSKQDEFPDTQSLASQEEAVNASGVILTGGIQHTGDEDWVKVNLPYSGAIQYSVESCNPITVWFKAYKKGTATLAYHTVFSGTGVYRSLTRLEPELYDYYINIYSNYVTDYEVSLAYSL